jgi:hypothetical protein
MTDNISKPITDDTIEIEPTTDDIGLSKLIEKVREELLPDPNKPEVVPLLYVDSIELELNVTVKKEGSSGFKIYVVDLGGKASIDKGQIIKVKLSPLLSKEQILEDFKANQTKKSKSMIDLSEKSVVKGGNDDKNP